MPSESLNMNSACIFEEEGEDLFFDSREDISSVLESCPGRPSCVDTICKEISIDPCYSVWISKPCSIKERRARFMQWMDSDSIKNSWDLNVDRATKLDDGDMLMRSGSEGSSSTSCWINEDPCTSGNGNSENEFEFAIRNLDNGSVFFVDKFDDDGNLRCSREDGSNLSMAMNAFDKSLGPSSSVRKLKQKEDKRSNNSKTVARKRKNGLLRRFGAVTCIIDRQTMEMDSNKSLKSRVQRVRVRSYRKKCKEFSAVYTGQEIKGHEGAILTMKFSPDGEYLASAGVDGIVRVWKVIECKRNDEDDIPENDISCIYFRVNKKSELAPLFVNKEKLNCKNMKRTSESACVVIPPQEFLLYEKPLHEFYGHDGDVLDLSWSRDNKHLLSSSVDKSVRLWKIGCDDCLKVFVHKNYVTCVQFNPVNENIFISGSIDGKIRIWEIKEHLVVDWTDISDIITALCYGLDGKGIVVGTMTGDCRFYDASDHLLQLDAQISLQSKKKSHDKRITGFQFCPKDHRKLLVTSADSKIRIFDGADVISKYKGFRNSGSQISASFTLDGRNIISASEDSNVYVWNHDDHKFTQNNIRSNRSYERFMSCHASVAIPWHGLTSKISEKCSTNFTLSCEFSEILPKGASATWPEENLPLSSEITNQTLCKSQCKFVKNSCKNSSNAWGQVIVTAGWDGRIRTFQNYGLPVNQ